MIWEASVHLADACDRSANELGEAFREGTIIGMTPVSHGVALPHLRLPTLDSAQMVLVRCAGGIDLDVDVEGADPGGIEPVQALFFLVSPLENPGRHLRILAQIAGRVDQGDFMDAWLAASDQQELKEAVLRDDRLLTLTLEQDGTGTSLIGLSLREMQMPDGTLIALVRRGPKVIIPRGDTVLAVGDRLTIIGEAANLRIMSGHFKKHPN